MDLASLIIGFGLFPFSAWLTIRIINRRERWAKWTAVVMVFLLAVLVYESFGYSWGGSADLRIEFLVVDSRTGQGINGSKIQVIQKEGSFCNDRTAQQFELLTDQSGKARRICEGCMSFGSRGGLKFNDIYSVHTPNWRVRTAAEGYAKSDEIDIEYDPVYRRQIKRVGPGFAELVVRVELSPDSRATEL